MIGKVRTCILNMPMNEGHDDPHDSSGYGNNGTNNGANWVSGDYGWAMDFNGSTDYVDCGDIDYSEITDITIGVWAYISSPNWGHNIILGNANSNCGDGFSMSYYTSGGKIYFYHANKNMSGIVTTDQWVYFTFVISSSDYTQAYINGQKTDVNPTPITGCSIDNVVNTIVGRGNTLYPFSGLIDGVRIENRILSAAEILAYFNATKTRHGL